MTGLAAFQKQNRLFGLIASIAIGAITGVIILTLLVVATRWDAMAAHTVQRLALTWSPAPFYLWALWSLRTMFVRFADAGPAFQPALAAALVRIGWGLILGAATTIALMPVVLTLTPPRPMGGSFAIFNVPALTLGVVRLALLATAHMLRRGQEIEAEAAALKTELGEFV